jgi:8-oxo-dGTP pyrophosphatase MutT (NUDIX family)
MISGYDCTFGYMLERTVRACNWPYFWEINHENKTVKLHGSNWKERSEQLQATLISERDRRSFKLLAGWTEELCAVYGPEKELVIYIEKVAAPLFGIVTYGVQMIAYQEDVKGMRLWIALRAKTKRTFPGMLDSTVGGSKLAAETPFECLVREAEEEASLPADVVWANSKACGTVNYVYMTDERAGGEMGLICPQVQFTYEMKMPVDLIPKPRDGEVESFELLSVEDVKAALKQGAFTPANGCIVLDFFVRHGVLTFENERDYIDIVSRLHRTLDFPTA